MEDNADLMSKTDIIYPYCYKIKETCKPCNERNMLTTTNVNSDPQFNCIIGLINYMQRQTSLINKEKKDEGYDNLFNCLKQYGDIYKKIGIELFVNPKTNEILFPDNQRIQSSLNEYLRNVKIDKSSTELIKTNIMLYNILLNDTLRKLYNEFYPSTGFSDLDSIQPKQYGINKIMGGKKSNKSKKPNKFNKSKTIKNRIKKIGLKLKLN